MNSEHVANPETNNEEASRSSFAEKMNEMPSYEEHMRRMSESVGRQSASGMAENGGVEVSGMAEGGKERDLSRFEQVADKYDNLEKLFENMSDALIEMGLSEEFRKNPAFEAILDRFLPMKRWDYLGNNSERKLGDLCKVQAIEPGAHGVGMNEGGLRFETKDTGFETSDFGDTVSEIKVNSPNKFSFTRHHEEPLFRDLNDHGKPYASAHNDLVECRLGEDGEITITEVSGTFRGVPKGLRESDYPHNFYQESCEEHRYAADGMEVGFASAQEARDTGDTGTQAISAARDGFFLTTGAGDLNNDQYSYRVTVQRIDGENARVHIVDASGEKQKVYDAVEHLNGEHGYQHMRLAGGERELQG